MSDYAVLPPQSAPARTKRPTCEATEECGEATSFLPSIPTSGVIETSADGARRLKFDLFRCRIESRDCRRGLSCE